MKTMVRFISMALICIQAMLCFSGYAQEINRDNEYLNKPIAPKTIDKSTWKETVNGLDYDELIQEEEPEKTENTQKSIQKPSSLFSSIPWLVKIVLFSGIIGLLVYILIRLMTQNSDRKLKKEKQKFSLEDAEEHLLEVDLKQFLNEALQNKQYGLAVRIYYLMTIKSMAESKIIQWKKEKTNNQYLIETRPLTIYDTFNEITGVYEKTWYGNMPVNQTAFQQIEATFNHFLKQVKTTSEN
jgi:hypothetical protein